jgi:uncharacterized protein
MSMKNKKSNIVTLRDSIVVEVFLIIISLCIIFFRHENAFLFLTRGVSIGEQVIIGLLIGLGLSLVLYIVLNVKKESISALDHLKVLAQSSSVSLLLVGILAGIGEEIFFRGVIQNFVGLLLASLLFMLTHAQFWAIPPIGIGGIAFAIFAFLCGLLLGYLYTTYGLICAILVHATIDSIAFIHLKSLFE